MRPTELEWFGNEIKRSSGLGMRSTELEWFGNEIKRNRVVWE